MRASFGIYTSPDEVDLLASALRAIAAGSYDGLYELDSRHGSYQPKGWDLAPQQLFSIASSAI